MDGMERAVHVAVGLRGRTHRTAGCHGFRFRGKLHVRPALRDAQGVVPFPVEQFRHFLKGVLALSLLFCQGIPFVGADLVALHAGLFGRWNLRIEAQAFSGFLPFFLRWAVYQQNGTREHQGKKRVDDKLRTPTFLFGCQRLVTRQSQQFLYLLYIRFHRSSCLDGLVLFSGHKSSRRICSMLIVPSLFPGPESAETIVYRQAARNRRKAVIVTKLRCLLVRRRQNSRIRPSARLRLAYPLFIVPRSLCPCSPGW